MELRNCTVCGKVFVYTNKNMCAACREVEENEYRLVKEYIYNHKGAALPEVHQATGVAAERIMKFLREGRLIETGAQWKELECESCGEVISSGRFCPKCTDRLTQELQAAGRQKRREETGAGDKGKVYTLDRLTGKER